MSQDLTSEVSHLGCGVNGLKTILVTGGAGFIGSHLVEALLQQGFKVINLDKLTYAARPLLAATTEPHPSYVAIEGDITDLPLLQHIFSAYQPDAVMHLAAESHVDNSINYATDFIDTNIVGTFRLLEAARLYYHGLSGGRARQFRFHHISTDEVFGQLGAEDPAFTEDSAYRPRNPYAATKAAADHLVRAWSNTYQLPVVITHSSNNYGPGQHPEKLLPKMILNALAGQPLPIYGDGLQTRDWIFVTDHVKALLEVLMHGRVGETYLIGGGNEHTNLEMVGRVCNILQLLQPPCRPGLQHYAELMTYVSDRPGHDRRYATDISKIRTELQWQPKTLLQQGLSETVRWYLDNRTALLQHYTKTQLAADDNESC